MVTNDSTTRGVAWMTRADVAEGREREEKLAHGHSTQERTLVLWLF